MKFQNLKIFTNFGQNFSENACFDGGWIPPVGVDFVNNSGLGPIFEDTATVQFDHRMLAYSTVSTTRRKTYFSDRLGVGISPWHLVMFCFAPYESMCLILNRG